MKITLEKLFNIQQSLGKLLTQDLPVSVSFKLSRLAKKVKTEMDLLEENRVKLVKKYGGKEKNENGEEVVRVSKKNMTKFSEELKTLLDVQVEIEVETVSISELGDLKLSALDLANLDDFITS